MADFDGLDLLGVSIAQAGKTYTASIPVAPAGSAPQITMQPSAAFASQPGGSIATRGMAYTAAQGKVGPSALSPTAAAFLAQAQTAGPVIAPAPVVSSVPVAVATPIATPQPVAAPAPAATPVTASPVDSSGGGSGGGDTGDDGGEGDEGGDDEDVDDSGGVDESDDADSSDDDDSDVGGGGGHGGGGHGFHGGGFRGGRGFRGGFIGPWYDYPDYPVEIFEIDSDDDEEGLTLLGAEIIGEFNITQAARQMNGLKQVTVGIGRTMVKHAMDIINETIKVAKGGVFQQTLEGALSSSQKAQGHLQWHEDKLTPLVLDPNSVYESGDDLKKWAMQAFIEANAAEETRAYQSQTWDAMWSEIAENIANLPKDVARVVKKGTEALTSGLKNLEEGASKVVTALKWTGIIVAVGAVGVGTWKLANVIKTARAIKR